LAQKGLFSAILSPTIKTLLRMRYQISELASYKKTLLDAIVIISTSEVSNEHDICNLQEIFYLLEAIEQKSLAVA